jgi:hypothetical protein
MVTLIIVSLDIRVAYLHIEFFFHINIIFLIFGVHWVFVFVVINSTCMNIMKKYSL